MRKAVYGLRALFAAVAAGALVVGIVLGVMIAAVQAAPQWRGFLLAAAVVLAGGLVLAAAAGLLGSPLPNRFVLELDLREPVSDGEQGDLLARLSGAPAPSLRELLEVLETAERDKRVVGLIARLGAAPGGLAQVQELRDAVASFRSSGKPATAFAVTFGEVGNGTGAYYLAAAFGDVVLQPSGDVGVTGLLAVTPFLRGVLDKLGIVWRGDRRHEYKNAFNMYTETSFTPAHREATGRIVESSFEQIVNGIAADRGMTADAVRAVIDTAPLLGDEAVRAGFVDRTGYWDEAVAALEARIGRGELQRVTAAVYKKKAVRRRQGTTVALIAGHGAVVAGRRRFTLPPGPSFSGDVVSAAFRAAVKDKRVKAILFRVDSPGGSYVASDQVWREVVRAREAGKPVVVSMGNVAGSGGYFVAMAATKIVAQPGTITGSIGVLAGKPLMTGLHEKIGFSTDEVHAGANATMFSTTQDYTDAQWDRFQMWLDRVYDDFTRKVAEGRGMTVARVGEIAKGRVWTGADALDIGLVDHLGGYRAAIALVRDALGVAPDARIRLKPFPKKKGHLAQLRRGPAPDTGADIGVDVASAAVELLAAAGARAVSDLAPGRADVLSMPDYLEGAW